MISHYDLYKIILNRLDPVFKTHMDDEQLGGGTTFSPGRMTFDFKCDHNFLGAYNRLIAERSSGKWTITQTIVNATFRVMGKYLVIEVYDDGSIKLIDTEKEISAVDRGFMMGLMRDISEFILKEKGSVNNEIDCIGLK